MSPVSETLKSAAPGLFASNAKESGDATGVGVGTGVGVAVGAALGDAVGDADGDDVGDDGAVGDEEGDVVGAGDAVGDEVGVGMSYNAKTAGCAGVIRIEPAIDAKVTVVPLTAAGPSKGAIQPVALSNAR